MGIPRNTGNLQNVHDFISARIGCRLTVFLSLVIVAATPCKSTRASTPKNTPSSNTRGADIVHILNVCGVAEDS
jgi:hypothetical protein